LKRAESATKVCESFNERHGEQPRVQVR
jgi:hypothetical protein